MFILISIITLLLLRLSIIKLILNFKIVTQIRLNHITWADILGLT